MVDDVHFMVHLVVGRSALHQSIIGVLEELVDVAQVVHLFFHLHQQLLLGVSELL